ncbi:MAG: hypothetical protein DWQ04_29815 [Chloroflexi bacterium]|nr:MAG: hypothetical protein DWQ04_29815 [Chloroflexota bacterium]
MGADDEAIMRLGGRLRSQWQSMLQQLTADWFNTNDLMVQDWQQLQAIQNDIIHVFQINDEFTALEAWLTSGFIAQSEWVYDPPEMVGDAREDTAVSHHTSIHNHHVPNLHLSTTGQLDEGQLRPPENVSLPEGMRPPRLSESPETVRGLQDLARELESEHPYQGIPEFDEESTSVSGEWLPIRDDVSLEGAQPLPGEGNLGRQATEPERPSNFPSSPHDQPERLHSKSANFIQPSFATTPEWWSEPPDFEDITLSIPERATLGLDLATVDLASGSFPNEPGNTVGATSNIKQHEQQPVSADSPLSDQSKSRQPKPAKMPPVRPGVNRPDPKWKASFSTVPETEQTREVEGPTEVDLDAILEAITEDIEREYRRFYGS